VARRRGLSVDDVVDAAADLADADGLTALRPAALAERLGVRPPSIYNYFDGRDAVVRALALRGLRELAGALRGAAVGRSGTDAVVAIAEAYRAYAHEHQGVYAAIGEAGVSDPDVVAAGTELVEVVLATLRSFSLDGDDAIHAVRALRAGMHGFVSIEAEGGMARPVDLDESYRRLIETLCAGLAAQ
jgi:AcrR family transcriptional regulator